MDTESTTHNLRLPGKSSYDLAKATGNRAVTTTAAPPAAAEAVATAAAAAAATTAAGGEEHTSIRAQQTRPSNGPTTTLHPEMRTYRKKTGGATQRKFVKKMIVFLMKEGVHSSGGESDSPTSTFASTQTKGVILGDEEAVVVRRVRDRILLAAKGGNMG